jgi:hypothetical protein
MVWRCWWRRDSVLAGEAVVDPASEVAAEDADADAEASSRRRMTPREPGESGSAKGCLDPGRVAAEALAEGSPPLKPESAWRSAEGMSEAEESLAAGRLHERSLCVCAGVREAESRPEEPSAESGSGGKKVAEERPAPSRRSSSSRPPSMGGVAAAPASGDNGLCRLPNMFSTSSWSSARAGPGRGMESAPDTRLSSSAKKRDCVRVRVEDMGVR